MGILIYPGGHRETVETLNESFVVPVPPPFLAMLEDTADGPEEGYTELRFRRVEMVAGDHKSYYYIPEGASDRDALEWLISGPKEYECERCERVSSGSVTKRTLFFIVREWLRARTTRIEKKKGASDE